jgi:hypothetical protein
MFGNPLWKLLKGPLKKILADRFSVLGGRFKGILSSTENDLIAVLKEQFFVPGFPSHFSYADIGKRGKRAIRFDYFAIDALTGSSKLRDELAARLKDNVDLGAARTQAGINAADWDRIVQQYSEAVLQFGLPLAVKHLADDDTAFAIGYSVIDLAKGEPIRIVKNGKQEDATRDLVVLYRSTGFSPPSVSDAKKAWKKRHDSSYEYKRAINGYVEFKVP